MTTVLLLPLLLLLLGVADCTVLRKTGLHTEGERPTASLNPRISRYQLPTGLLDSRVPADLRVTMGISSDCDDGKTDLETDWDGSADEYTCTHPMQVSLSREQAIPHCTVVPDKYYGKTSFQKHRCMNETLEYSENIPTYGVHRPLWAAFGEYKYLPVQRWLHNIEHGSVVMLYHPCADSAEVDHLKQLVRGCIRKHIITPYNKLSINRPLALVAWGCRLEMSKVDVAAVQNFIRDKALHGVEGHMARDGQFNVELLHRAQTPDGSDINDSVLCPALAPSNDLASPAELQ